MSWQHAVLSDDGGACVIEDLGSSNGTFVGAERIQRQVLNAGEVVRIGPFELALQMRAAPSPTSASEHTMFDMAAFRGVPPVARRAASKQPAATLAADQPSLAGCASRRLSESYRTANLRQEVDRRPDRRGAGRSARHGLCAVGGLAAGRWVCTRPSCR